MSTPQNAAQFPKLVTVSMVGIRLLAPLPWCPLEKISERPGSEPVADKGPWAGPTVACDACECGRLPDMSTGMSVNLL
jgi:hypothetical protein